MKKIEEKAKESWTSRNYDDPRGIGLKPVYIAGYKDGFQDSKKMFLSNVLGALKEAGYSLSVIQENMLIAKIQDERL